MEVTPNRNHNNKRSSEDESSQGEEEDYDGVSSIYEFNDDTDPSLDLSFDDVMAFDGILEVPVTATTMTTPAVATRPLPKRRKKVINYKEDMEDDNVKPTVVFKLFKGKRVDRPKHEADKKLAPIDSFLQSNEDEEEGMSLSVFKRSTRNNGKKNLAPVDNPVDNFLTESAFVNDDDSNVEDTQRQQSNMFPIGFKVKKLFEDGNWYNGEVVSEPETVADGQRVWKILYEDGDSEDLNRDEILEVAVHHVQGNTEPEESNEDDGNNQESAGEKEDGAKKPPAKQWKGYKANYNNYDDVLHDLVSLIGITHDEAKAALAQMTPPYGMNKAVQLIHQAKKNPRNYRQVTRGKFHPHAGMRVRKNFAGNQYHGTVASNGETMTTDEGKEIMRWRVEWDDGDYEDMDFDELLESQADRPIRPHPVRGRQLNCLEIFSGCGIISQEFANRRWRVRSIDIDPMSNATDKLDIMNLCFEDIDMIPDFIWASPPCFTYSNKSGGSHRRPCNGEFEISVAAHENNRYFARLSYTLKWAIKKHPHLIIGIENPVGLLRKMPLMQKLVMDLNLKETMVHYCAFGRDDKKPTFIWTNDFNLHATLSEFQCKDKCPYGQAGALHPLGARQHGSKYNAAAIPQPLAEEVAQHVDSELYRRRIRYTAEATMTPEEIAEFNEAISKKAPTASVVTTAIALAAEKAAVETEASTATEDSTPGCVLL